LQNNSVLEDARKANVALEEKTYNKLLQGFGAVGDLPQIRKIASDMQQHSKQMDIKSREVIRKLGRGGPLFSTLVNELTEKDGN
jgi:hypothetical protein